jgi:hypothetical protein
MYTLTVTAFKGSTAIAEGSKSSVTISESLETRVSIVLGPKPNAGNGTFAYDLTIPSGISDPTLYVTTLTGDAVSGGTISLTAGQNNTGTLNLASGYYKARFVLTQGDMVAGFNSEFIHIYSGLTSTLSREFTAFEPQKVTAFDLTGLFPAPVIGVDPVLTLVADQYNGTIQWKVGGIAHSGPFEGNRVYTAEITLEPDIAYTFEGIGANVFSHSGIQGTNNANSGVLTLVFEATAAVSGGLVIEIGFNHGDIDVSGSNGVNTIYRDGAPNSLTLSVSGYTDMSWYVDAGMTELTGNPLTLQAADYGIGSHIVNFNGYKGGVPFSQMVPFTVAEEGGSDPHDPNGNAVITLKSLDLGDGAFSQADFTLSKSSGTTSQTISISGSGYTDPRWIVDGILKGTATTITLQAADYGVGGHTLSLDISKDGKSWSKEIRFTITN